MISGRLLPLILGMSLLAIAGATARQKETESERLLNKEITFLVGESKSPRTIKAVEVYSRRHRRVIYHSFSGLLLHPASNLKIITTSCALQNLGGSYDFKTRFETSGVERADTLFGDLIAIGGGDPILSDADLDSSAAMISRSGLRFIEGNIVVDISRFDSLQWGNGWMWDDEPASFAMFISPTCLDHNTVTVNISFDPISHKLVATTFPQTGFVKIVCAALSGDVDSLSVTRIMANDTNTIFIGGTYSDRFSPSTFDFSVRHPAHYFGTVLRELLEEHGVRVGGKLIVTRHYSSPVTPKDIFTFEHSIDTVITYTNKVSDNLGAECFLREVPVEVFGEVGSAENGIKAEETFLEQCGVDSTEFYVVDGSGVSHYDLITPNAVVKVLNHMLNEPTKQIFIHSLPIGGADGSLKNRMTDKFVAGRVHAKTGSISGVSTLSGYAIAQRDTLVFSMMMQNFIGSGDSMRALQDRLCALLTQYSDNERTFARNLRTHRIGTYGIVRERRIRPRHESQQIRAGKEKRLSTVPAQKHVEKH